jgi:hypothetical protein
MRYGMISSLLFLVSWITLKLIFLRNEHDNWIDHYILLSIWIGSPFIGIMSGIQGVSTDKKKSLSVVSILLNILTIAYWLIAPHYILSK